MTMTTTTTAIGSLAFDKHDSPLMRAFHEPILPALVYVERTCLATGETATGSGTVIGYQGNAKDGWLPIIATAGHVVRSDTRNESVFRLSRFSFDDPAHPTTRTAMFESGTLTPRSPCALYYSGPGHEVVDIALIRGPTACTDGTPFLPLDHEGNVRAGTAPIEAGHFWAPEGTRVAWAGFAQIVTELAGRPQPSYFEGSVSALVLRDDLPLYVLDGHNAFGVSGGPLWALDAQSHSRVIGIVVNYQGHSDAPGVPGFTCATPIQPLRLFLEQAWRATVLCRAPAAAAAQEADARAKKRDRNARKRGTKGAR